MATLEERQDQIALKYLELARAEILERMKAANQILVLYVGGVGALVGWVYKVKGDAGTSPDLYPEILFPMGLVVTFLALAASWIIFHNERMVNALASYQKLELAQHLGAVLPQVKLWESSAALRSADHHLTTFLTMTVQGTLIIGPCAGFCIAMIYKFSATHVGFIEWSCMIFAGVFTLFAAGLTFWMILERTHLRSR